MQKIKVLKLSHLKMSTIKTMTPITLELQYSVADKEMTEIKEEFRSKIFYILIKYASIFQMKSSLHETTPH